MRKLVSNPRCSASNVTLYHYGKIITKEREIEIGNCGRWYLRVRRKMMGIRTIRNAFHTPMWIWVYLAINIRIA